MMGPPMHLFKLLHLSFSSVCYCWVVVAVCCCFMGVGGGGGCLLVFFVFLTLKEKK